MVPVVGIGLGQVHETTAAPVILTNGSVGVEWKGIGVVYARADEGVVELSIFYESHIPQEIKDELAERFGVGIYEWRVSK